MKRILAAAAVFMAAAAVCTATAAADDVLCTTEEYSGETLVYNEAVCPLLLPGPDGSSVALRWIGIQGLPVTVHYGPADENGQLPPEHERIVVEPEQARYIIRTEPLWLYGTELPLDPSVELVYGLSEDETDPETLYPVRPDGDGVLTAVFTSDSHVANAEDARRFEAMMQRASERMYPDVICHVGDLNNNIRTAPDMLANHAPILRSVPIAPVCGNHDAYQVFYEFFRMPTLETENPNSFFSKELMNYWFIRENVLFIGLNCEARDIDAHGEYIRRITGEHPECEWTVVMLHFSLFSNGSHRKDALVKNFQFRLAPVMAEADVDLVIGGHDHEYDRSFLYSGTEIVPDSGGSSAVKKAGETLYLSVPTATGTKFYPWKIPYKEINADPAAEGLADEAGYVLAAFTKDGLVIRAVSGQDEPVDLFVLKKAPAEE